MDYFADDTKGEGNLSVLTSNYLQDTFSKVQNFCVSLYFCVNTCMFMYKGFQFLFYHSVLFEFCKHVHIFH